MRLELIAGGVAAAAIATIAVAQVQAPAPTQPPRVPGYLTPDTAPQIVRIIPPPPVEGGDRQKFDLDTFRATRKLEGSPRWQLAQADISYAVPYLLQAFSCAVGVQMTPQNAPKTALLLQRTLRDTGMVSNGAKDVFNRKRPYLYVQGKVCVPNPDELARTTDYPSGHATLSWGSGLVLAEMAPDRATEILTRARGYGDSRIVCGVHTVSAVEAGRVTGAATVAAMHGSAEFRADLDGARAELAALRKSGTPPQTATCQVDAGLIANTPY